MNHSLSRSNLTKNHKSSQWKYFDCSKFPKVLVKRLYNTFIFNSIKTKNSCGMFSLCKILWEVPHGVLGFDEVAWLFFVVSREPLYSRISQILKKVANSKSECNKTLEKVPKLQKLWRNPYLLVSCEELGNFCIRATYS